MPSVPFVIGLSLVDAVNTVAAAGLGVGGISSSISSDVAAGAVLSTDPEAGTEVDAGSLVSLVLSDGPPAPPDPPPGFEVPDVMGFRFDDAKATLQAAGWTVTASSEFSADEDFGLIISQSPPGGSFGPQPGEVAIVVSKGSPPGPPPPPPPPPEPI